MPYRNEHAARIRDPSRYTRFRRENDKFGSGIDAIWGIKGKTVELQAIRFDANKFTVTQAKRWLSAHGYRPILFEPATNGKENAAMNEEFFLIEAQADGKVNPRVMGMAYSGGKMNLPGWKHPVVVDLAGLELPGSVPLLANHENRTASRVGQVRGHIEESALVIEGEITSSGGVAGGIVEQAKAGADWQLSIGAEVKDAELVAKGRSREVNGIKHEGPFYHVKASVLREVSVVAVGADASTRLKVAAKFELTGYDRLEAGDVRPEESRIDAGGWQNDSSLENVSGSDKQKDSSEKVKAMNNSSLQPPASSLKPAEAAREEAERAVKAERNRVSDIQAICSGEFPKIEHEAISSGWSADQTREKVLKAIRDKRPTADIGFVVSPERNPIDTAKRLEAALCFRAGIDEKTLLAAYGEALVSEAYHDRDVSLQQLFVECARAEGVSLPRHFCNDTIRAAFSTVSLPGILNNVANKKLLKSFRAQAIIAPRLCSEGELTDFKESERYRLTDVGDLEPVAPDGEIKHGGLAEEKATNQLKTYGKTFTLTREMIYNDDLGAFLRVPEGMGARAARKVDQLFFMRLLANPNSLFSAANNNYITGTDSVLSTASLALAIQMFLDQVDADKQPINVSPRFLLVPTALKMVAREILNSTILLSVGATNTQRIPTYNPLADENLEAVASPYLSNANYTGSSAKSWYLFGDPAVVDTFEIGYLRGRREPTVERGDTDFDTLGIKFRVFYDLGVREQDHRGVFKSNGE